jgi:thiol-disulfide isomerase/thioredoxin
MSIDTEQSVAPPAAGAVRRPPVSARALADATAPPPRAVSPLLLGIVVGGAVLALVLVVLIAGNITHPPPTPPTSAPSGAAGGTNAQAADALTEDVVPGHLAADFTVQTLDGQTVHLADYRGKKAVWLNFWASWCGPCKQEMPDMEKLYQSYKDKDLVMLGFDFREDKPTVEGFVNSQNYHWTFLLEPGVDTARR